MKNTTLLKTRFAEQALQKKDLQLIKGGKRSHADKLEKKQRHETAKQLRKAERDAHRLERRGKRACHH